MTKIGDSFLTPKCPKCKKEASTVAVDGTLHTAVGERDGIVRVVGSTTRFSCDCPNGHKWSFMR